MIHEEELMSWLIATCIAIIVGKELLSVGIVNAIVSGELLAMFSVAYVRKLTLVSLAICAVVISIYVSLKIVSMLDIRSIWQTEEESQ